MEGVVLDDAVVRLCECCGQEFFAGGQGAAVVLLYHCRGEGFHPFEAVVQCAADAGDESAEPGVVPVDAGRSDDGRFVVCADQRAGRDKPEPGVHLFGGDCGACAAKRGFDGYFGVPVGYPAIVVVEQSLLDRVWGVAGGPWGHDRVAGGIGCDDHRADHHSFSFFVEGLIFSKFAVPNQAGLRSGGRRPDIR